MTLEHHKRCLLSEDYDKDNRFTPFRKNISIKYYSYQILTIKSKNYRILVITIIFFFLDRYIYVYIGTFAQYILLY